MAVRHSSEQEYHLCPTIRHQGLQTLSKTGVKDAKTYYAVKYTHTRIL